MNDAAELERKRLERFLTAGGKKATPVSFKKTTTTTTNTGSNGNNGSGAPTTTSSPKPPTTTTSLGSSPSYKHEEKRKWEIKQERGRAEFAAASAGKKHLEMEDSAAEAAARRSVGVSAGAAVNVESYEERERRRRAEWKRQASPSLALLDLLEGDADSDQSELKSRSAAAGKVAAPAPVAAKGASKPATGGGVRSASEEAALKELLSFTSDTAPQTTKKNEASPLSSSSSSSSSNGGVRLSPRLEDKQQTADTFAQIGNVLNSLNDLLGDGDHNGHASHSSAPTSVGAVDAVYVSGLPAAHARSSDYPAKKSESGSRGRANAKPKTKEERRLAKEARRPEWAQTLYQEFEESETEEQRDYEYVDQQLWKVDLDQEELESKEFVKDAQDGIQKLEAVSAMIEPDMDVDDFDEERFSLGIKEFVYSGKKTIRYIKRKSKQGSVRMAGEAKKFMDDSVALMDTARDYKSSRTEKAKAKFSRTVRKVKEGAQKLTKTVTNAVEDEVERMRELREKIRAAEHDRREREREEAEARESRKAAAEREASVTRLSFDLDQFLYRIKKIEDDAFRFDYGGAVDLLKRVRDVKESVPVLLAYLSGAAAQQFTHLNTEITEISTATARFVKDWQAGGSSKAENMRQTGNIVKLSRKFQQNLMDLILFI